REATRPEAGDQLDEHDHAGERECQREPPPGRRAGRRGSVDMAGVSRHERDRNREGYNRGMHTDRTLELHGRHYHYTEWGAPAAPAVIFLHGITGHARTWDDEARLLAERFHVVVLDQRGHG